MHLPPVPPRSSSSTPQASRPRPQRPPKLDLAALHQPPTGGLDVDEHRSQSAEAMRQAGERARAVRLRRQAEHKLTGGWSAPVTPQGAVDALPLPASIRARLTRPPLAPRRETNHVPPSAPPVLTRHPHQRQESDESSGSSFACRGLGASPEPHAIPTVEVSHWSATSSEGSSCRENSHVQEGEAGRPASLLEYEQLLQHDAPMIRTSTEMTPQAGHSPHSERSSVLLTPLASMGQEPRWSMVYPPRGKPF